MKEENNPSRDVGWGLGASNASPKDSAAQEYADPPREKHGQPLTKHIYIYIYIHAYIHRII